MKAIILAAGRGSRMAGHTADAPKCFVELGGRRLIDWQVAALQRAGVREIGIVRGYRSEAFDEAYGDRFHWFDNSRWSSSNIVQSLTCASLWLRGWPCIVSYSDIVYSSETVQRLLSHEADELSLTYDPNWLQLWSLRFPDPRLDAESFRLSASSYIMEIGRKVVDVAEIQGQYMGLLRFTPSCWHRIERYLDEIDSSDRDKLDMTTLLQRLIEGGEPVFGIPSSGPWGEVDTADDLRLYEELNLGQSLFHHEHA